jgi:uncharacterized protein
VATLRSIFVYPIKGCKPLVVDAWSVQARGLAHDRTFMVVDPKGNALTLRETPELLRIVPLCEGDNISLTALGHPSMRLPEAGDGPVARSLLFEEYVDVARSSEGSTWVSAVLGREVSLVSRARSYARKPSSRFPTDEVELVDVYAVTILSTASLQELQRRGLPREGLLERFRPNLLVDTDEAFWEDEPWALSIGTAQLSFAKRTSRCMVVNVDPGTGQSAPDTLKTVAAFRTEDQKAYLAGNYVVRGTGSIRIGDTFERTQRIES